MDEEPESPMGASVSGGPVDAHAEPFEQIPIPTRQSGPDGLLRLWFEDSEPRHVVDVLSGYDVIVVHGLHGERDAPWKNPGSGDSSWMCHRQWEGKRVFSFGYDVRKILVGRQTREAIRKQSLALLNELKSARERDSMSRPIAFLAHDIGGIIVKDALVSAGLYTKTYGDIFDYTRFLIFYGCPHRSDGILDMGNRMARFLFRRFMESKIGDAVTVKSTEGLAAGVLEINGLFLQSKNVLRTHVVSLYAGTQEEGTDFDPIFDMFCGTLGAPFERQIKSSSNDQAEIFQNRQRMQLQLAPDPRTLGNERTLLNLASPVYTFLTAHSSDHPFRWITSDETYQSWLHHEDPQLLYVYGTGVQEASEHIFYSLDENRQGSEKNEVVVYFTFDRHDIRYASAKDMLGTFLAQIIDHHPTFAEFLLIQFNRLRLDRSLNEFDHLSLFEYFRVRGQIDDITCVINFFDDCDAASRGVFLRRFAHISRVHERRWRIVVTSREPGVLRDELDGWPSLDLDGAAPNGSQGAPLLDPFSLLKLAPRLSMDKGAIEQQVADLSGTSSIVAAVILQQARVREEWSAHSVLRSYVTSPNDSALKPVLRWVLDSASDPQQARRIITWVLYACMPLTIWELGTAILSDSPSDHGVGDAPDAEFIASVVDKIQTWFAGICSIVDNEVLVTTLPIRHSLEQLLEEEGVRGHEIIAETCLAYLQRDGVREMIEATLLEPYILPDTDPLSMDAPTFPDRTSLCSYAIKYWPRHFKQLVPRPKSSLELLRGFVESGSARTWTKGCWVLALPILRSSRIQALYPLFSAFGIAEDAEQWRSSDEELSLALAEAALNGFGDAMRSLLPRAKHTESSLQEALVCAGSYGDEATLLDLINYIKVNSPGFPWPPYLIYRASWLGLDKAVSALLDLGVPVRQDDDATRHSTPLLNAVRNGHIAVVKVLLGRGADVTHRGPFGQTALHVACSSSDADVTRVVAEAGADLNARDDNSFTPLYEASLWGNFKCVEVLVDLGADTSLATRDPGAEETSPGWTPLIVSAEEGHIRSLQILLDARANPNLPGPHGTPLHYAVGKGHFQICQMLLAAGADPNHRSLKPPILMQVFALVAQSSLRFQMLELLVENGAQVDARDGSGNTALLRAVRVGDVRCVDYLISHGADVHDANNNGDTALATAIANDHVDVASLLIRRGADPNRPLSQTGSSTPPLVDAIANPSMVRLLLGHGADPDAGSSEGLSPLMLAASQNLSRTAQILLDHGASVDLAVMEASASPNSGFTALSFAASRGNSDIIRLLADSPPGADVNHRAADGSTPVHLALAASGDENALRALLEFRPDVSVADAAGATPLHCVRAWTAIEDVRLLVRAGAPLDSPDDEGCTPLHVALRNGNADAATYLLARGAGVHVVSAAHGSPLHMACRTTGIGLGMLRKLVEAGADVDGVVPLAGSGGGDGVGTALQVAIMRGWVGTRDSLGAVVRFLVDEGGADVGHLAGLYGTALAVAALRGESGVAAFLLQRGAEVGMADKMGRLPLHLAMIGGLDTAEVLCAAGADPKARDRAGRSVLHWAAQAGRADAVRYVLDLLDGKEGFDIDSRDNDGWTALCWAARWCGTALRAVATEAQAEVIRLLLDRGAKRDTNIASPGKERWTPLQIAQYGGAPERVLELLRVPAATSRDEDVDHGGERRESGNGPMPPIRKAFLNYDTYCTFCLGEIRGFRYQCNDCAYISFCFKCYNSRHRLHTEGHPFDEIGPEFASTYSTSEISLYLKRHSDTESGSDSDSDEEYSSEQDQDQES